MRWIGKAAGISAVSAEGASDCGESLKPANLSLCELSLLSEIIL